MMPELPWNVLWERFGKFLQLTYVVTIVSGFVIAAELSAIFLSGTAEYKQGLVTSYLSRLSRFDRKDLDLLTALVLGLSAAILAYLIGYTARAFFITIYGFLTRITLSIRYLIISGYLTVRDYQSNRRAGDKPSSRFDSIVMGLPRLDELQERWHKYLSKWRGIRDRYLPVLRRSILPPEAVWRSLIVTYGESEVKRVLSKHSFGASKRSFGVDFQNVNEDFELPDRPGNNPSMEYVYEYCSAWLKRYAPDVNPPQDLSRWGLRYSWAVPIILAPAAYSSLTGDTVIADHPTRFTLLAIALTLWIIRSPQTQLRSYPPLVFQRFVMAQFLFEARPQDDLPSNQPAAEDAAKVRKIPNPEQQSSSWAP